MTRMKRTLLAIGKTKKTMLLALSLLIALVAILSLPKPDNNDALAQRPGAAPGGAKPGAPAGMPAMPQLLVRVDAVGVLDHTQPVPKVGTVAAKETVQIVTRVSGYLMKVAFTEGDFVNKGDLLFEIEDTIYQINVKIAKSQIQQIEADIALAKSNQVRVEKLVPDRTATQQELDEVVRTIALHEARLEEAKARLDLANNDLGYTKITAPLSGRIGAKQFSVGNYLTPQSGVLATIMQFDPITVNFPVTEREFTTYFHQSSEKKEAKIEILLADGKPYEGEFRIDFLDNYVDRFSGQLMVYLLCDNKDGKLFPGGFTTVRLSEKYEQPRPAVSVSALQTDGTSHNVYVVNVIVDEKGNPVLDESGKEMYKADPRPVTLGPQVMGQQIIASGLTPGEKVVVGGLNKIMMPGQPIIPVPTPALMQQMQAAQANQASQDTGKTEEQSEEVEEQ